MEISAFEEGQEVQFPRRDGQKRQEPHRDEPARKAFICSRASATNAKICRMDAATAAKNRTVVTIAAAVIVASIHRQISTSTFLMAVAADIILTD